MPRISVTRDSGYADALRAYQVVLDGRELGDLRPGETRTFDVAPGAHTLTMKIDWCGSKPLEIALAPDETAHFRAESNLRGIRLMLAIWYVLFQRDAYLLLERVDPV